MNELLIEIAEVVGGENIRATEKFGAHNNSNHESYAVVLEELQEALEETKLFETQLNAFWMYVKANNRETALEAAEAMHETAIKAAAEWVQVATTSFKASVTARKALKEERKVQNDNTRTHKRSRR